MNLTADLERYARAIAGRLIQIDGPRKDRRGILYRCGDRKFRNYDAAVRHRERHNQRIAAEGRLAASAPDLLRGARAVIRRGDRSDLAAAVRDLAAVIIFIDAKENPHELDRTTARLRPRRVCGPVGADDRARRGRARDSQARE